MVVRTAQSTPSDQFTGLPKSSEALSVRARALEKLKTEDVIQGAIEAFGDRLIISTAFGPAGLCLMHMSQRFDPKVQAYNIDTGFAFPETRALIDVWVKQRQLNLKSVLPVLTPEAQDQKHGEKLWERDPDLCCSIRKVEPNHRALSGADIWLSALRRDQSKSRANVPMLSWVTLPNGHSLFKLCPLVQWTKKDVWSYIAEHELPYNPLHDRGYPSLGCTHCTRPVGEGEGERAGRWAGRSKQECGIHLPSQPLRRAG